MCDLGGQLLVSRRQKLAFAFLAFSCAASFALRVGEVAAALEADCRKLSYSSITDSFCLVSQPETRQFECRDHCATVTIVGFGGGVLEIFSYERHPSPVWRRAGRLVGVTSEVGFEGETADIVEGIRSDALLEAIVWPVAAVVAFVLLLFLRFWFRTGTCPLGAKSLLDHARWFCGDSREALDLCLADIKRDRKEMIEDGYGAWFVWIVGVWQTARAITPIAVEFAVDVVAAIVPIAQIWRRIWRRGS